MLWNLFKWLSFTKNATRCACPKFCTAFGLFPVLSTNESIVWKLCESWFIGQWYDCIVKSWSNDCTWRNVQFVTANIETIYNVVLHAKWFGCRWICTTEIGQPEKTRAEFQSTEFAVSKVVQSSNAYNLWKYHDNNNSTKWWWVHCHEFVYNQQIWSWHTKLLQFNDQLLWSKRNELH